MTQILVVSGQVTSGTTKVQYIPGARKDRCGSSTGWWKQHRTVHIGIARLCSGGRCYRNQSWRHAHSPPGSRHKACSVSAWTSCWSLLGCSRKDSWGSPLSPPSCHPLLSCIRPLGPCIVSRCLVSFRILHSKLLVRWNKSSYGSKTSKKKNCPVDPCETMKPCLGGHSPIAINRFGTDFDTTNEQGHKSVGYEPGQRNYGKHLFLYRRRSSVQSL